MPKMVTKIEGRGNGIKTVSFICIYLLSLLKVIVNMVDIAKALRVHPSCLFELLLIYVCMFILLSLLLELYQIPRNFLVLNLEPRYVCIELLF